jgi:pyruvate dehydrogenase E2 component (dihydrolipoamide acetyltransferase)
MAQAAAIRPACARPVVHASLAADHRASDGHLGARCLGALDAALQQPQALDRSSA